MDENEFADAEDFLGDEQEMLLEDEGFEEYDPVEAEDPFAGIPAHLRDPEREAEILGLRDQVAYLSEPDDWAATQVTAQLNDFEEQAGQTLDDATANLLGRLADKNRDDNGVPSLDNALGAARACRRRALRLQQEAPGRRPPSRYR
jgi:hypothetical protein